MLFEMRFNRRFLGFFGHLDRVLRESRNKDQGAKNKDNNVSFHML